VGWGWEKSLIPVGFGYGDGDEFFMRGWVCDSETRPRPAPLPSLLVLHTNKDYAQWAYIINIEFLIVVLFLVRYLIMFY